MINPVMKVTDNGIVLNDSDEIVSQVLKSLCYNNTFCPNVKRVIYNLSSRRGEKSHRKEYTLATTVYFADGTKTTVKNSVHDKVDITTEKVKLSDGSEIEVETATVESREVGLVYALVKRMIGEPDENGVVSKGLCTFIGKMIASATNQPVENARLEAEEKIRKAKKSELKKASKKEKPSLRGCVESLSDVIDRLDKRLSYLEGCNCKKTPKKK